MQGNESKTFKKKNTLVKLDNKIFYFLSGWFEQQQKRSSQDDCVNDVIANLILKLETFK